MQLIELREYASRRGWEIPGEYVDHGFSGATQSRPELNRLMVDAHTRQFDVVLCWKVDRFGRSLRHLVNALADLDSYGVAFVSLRDNLDLSTPAGSSNPFFDSGVATARDTLPIVVGTGFVAIDHAHASNLGSPPIVSFISGCPLHAYDQSGGRV
jgi:DNA invertase Pin-like site-specific DNA recombinase